MGTLVNVYVNLFLRGVLSPSMHLLFAGTLPVAYGYFANLSYMYLENNQLSGALHCIALCRSFIFYSFFDRSCISLNSLPFVSLSLVYITVCFCRRLTFVQFSL